VNRRFIQVVILILDPHLMIYYMRFVTGMLWFLYKIVVLYTIIVFGLTYWTFTSHWIAGFMMLSLPLLLVIHFLFLGIWVVVAPKRVATSIIVLALAFPFLKRTVGFSKSSSDPAPEGPQMKVLNYNIGNFSIFKGGMEQDRKNEVKEWLVEQDADVICFQEFFHHKLVSDFDFIGLLSNTGYIHSVYADITGNKKSSYIRGLVIFSKYPIIQHRTKIFEEQNGILQADILYEGDTIRTINVHLYSMALKLSRLAAQKQYDGVKREGRTTARQIKTGFVNRAKEVNELAEWVGSSPYPTLVCGDFNETPYSYVYGRMNRLLTNAFEEKGIGFGFTFNRLPYFIRIDHQFYDKSKLQLIDFKTLNKTPYSDHYPIVGTYTVK